MIQLLKRNSVGLPVGIRRQALRPSVVAKATRAVDRSITLVQEWLEGADRVVDKTVAYGIIVAAFTVMVAALAGKFLR